MIPFKAIAVDMDGTFEDNNLSYDHKRFSKLLNKSCALNIPFIVCSGRTLTRLKLDFKSFDDNIFFVSDNGALVYHKKRVISENVIDHDIACKLIDYLINELNFKDIVISAKYHDYLFKDADEQYKQMMQFYHPNYLEFLSLHELPDNDKIYKLMINCPRKFVSKIEHDFNLKYSNQIHATSSGYRDIDIIPYGINKAKGLELLLHTLNLTGSDLIAFGDDMNDLEMLKFAKYSYVMENGNPKLKSIFKRIAPSNEKMGVMSVLEQYLE